MTATPYNKTYLDLSNQLRLFVPEDQDLGIRTEQLLHDLGGEIEFNRKYQAPVRSLSAFEKSEHSDDWRELMRLYMVRRTRSFIQANYAREDGTGRKYLEFPDGSRSYFPLRQPRTITFGFDEDNPKSHGTYGLFYSEEVVNLLNSLNLPRYGLGNYAVSEKSAQGKSATPAESLQLKSLSRAGKRLMGFCRTNLFKRLESGGPAFLQSIDRHILRNYISLHAIANDLPLPIGTQEASLLDTRNNDQDSDSLAVTLLDPEVDELIETDSLPEDNRQSQIANPRSLESDYRRRAAQVYQEYATRYQHHFKWIRPGLFKPSLTKDLSSDAIALIGLLKQVGEWAADRDHLRARIPRHFPATPNTTTWSSRGQSGTKAYQSQLDWGAGKIYLLRVVVRDDVDPLLVVTVYKTSKIKKYWR